MLETELETSSNFSSERGNKRRFGLSTRLDWSSRFLEAILCHLGLNCSVALTPSSCTLSAFAARKLVEITVALHPKKHAALRPSECFDSRVGSKMTLFCDSNSWEHSSCGASCVWHKHPAGRFSARVFSLFFFHTSGMGSSFSVVFTMFLLFHVLFWCLKCCHLQW